MFAPQPALAGLAPPTTAAEEDGAAAADAAVWFAVPKSRISKSKKRIKNANAGPKPVTYKLCTGCGKPVLRHRMWKCCVEKATREVAAQKAAAAEGAAAAEVAAPR